MSTLPLPVPVRQPAPVPAQTRQEKRAAEAPQSIGHLLASVPCADDMFGDEIEDDPLCHPGSPACRRRFKECLDVTDICWDSWLPIGATAADVAALCARLVAQGWCNANETSCYIDIGDGGKVEVEDVDGEIATRIAALGYVDVVASIDTSTWIRQTGGR